MSSCTTDPSTTRFLVDQPYKAVGMESTQEGLLEYSHPRALRTELLDHALLSIEAEPSSLLNRMTGAPSTTQQAFTQEQREFFAKHLSRALQKAMPLETVTCPWGTLRGNGIWEITPDG